MRRFNLVVLTICSSVIFLTGCGNVFPQRNTVQSPATGFYFSSNQSSATSTDPTGIKENFACSGKPTVHPQLENSMANMTDSDFEVCPNKEIQNTAQVMLKGDFSDNDTICVFPARQSAAGYMSWFSDPTNAGAPLVKCNKNSDYTGEVAFSFPTLQNVAGFNAVFVVDPNDAPQMGLCLINQMQNCPFYYYGKFR